MKALVKIDELGFRARLFLAAILMLPAGLEFLGRRFDADPHGRPRRDGRLKRANLGLVNAAYMGMGVMRLVPNIPNAGL